MSYDWTKEAQSDGPTQTEKLPSGTHDVEITRVVFGPKDGPPFASRNGDPQIMVIFADNEGREASQMVTLSRKAGWVLAKVLRAADVHLSKMTADGIKPADFANPQFATANLVSRRLRVRVEWARSERDGKDYADVMPVATGAAYQPQSPQPTPATGDNIPI